MKLLLSIFSFMLLRHTALAYMNVEEAQATPGEQTSNLYKLNAATAIKIKKLREIDKVLARNPDAVINSENDIADLLEDKAQMALDEQNQLTLQYQDTVKRTAQKKNLVVSNSKSYQQINQVAFSAVKDTKSVLELKQKLRRR